MIRDVRASEKDTTRKKLGVWSLHGPTVVVFSQLFYCGFELKLYTIDRVVCLFVCTSLPTYWLRLLKLRCVRARFQALLLGRHAWISCASWNYSTYPLGPHDIDPIGTTHATASNGGTNFTLVCYKIKRLFTCMVPSRTDSFN